MCLKWDFSGIEGNCATICKQLQIRIISENIFSLILMVYRHRKLGYPKNLSGGGVVGLNGGSRVLACYAIGNVNSKGSSTGNVHIGGLFGDNYTVVTACYWKNNQEQGIGRNQHNTAPEATKVDGTDVTWQKAVDAMNTALQNAGSGWRYELNGALPTLRKL